MAMGIFLPPTTAAAHLVRSNAMDTASTSADKFTICNVRRDFPEWHHGRLHYALWALDLESPTVTQRMQAAQRHLAAWLLDGYCRQPHATLGLCGFVSATPQQADDFAAPALRTQLAALHRACPRMFEIEIGGLASFSSVPYLTLHGTGNNLSTLRECVAQGTLNTPQEQYTPHVTVGLYSQAWPLAAVQAQLDSFTLTQRLSVQIRGISLLCYEAKQIGGPLQRIAHYDFDLGTLHWNDSMPVALQCLQKMG